jgi:thioredoxin reductase
MYDLIVVGGGPAGLTATLYALSKRLNMLLVSKDLGGQTNYHMEVPITEDQPVIRGIEIVNKIKAELERQNFPHRIDTVERVSRYQEGFAVKTQSDQVLQARALIIATGVQHPRLNVTGEAQYLMRGLSYSALSYAHLFVGKKVVIIGDGERALRSAAEMALAAEHVYLVGPSARVLASPLGKKLKAASNVTVLESAWVTEVQGDTTYARRVAVREPDGQSSIISADGFFIEMPLIPNSQMVVGLVDLEPQGNIKIDARNRTNVPGIFAAGDVASTHAEQVLVAIGGGAKAALSAYEYLLPIL